MKRILLALPLFAFFLFTGCEKEDAVGGLDLVFKANYDGQPLVMLDEYDYDDGLKMTFQRFNFFISNVELYRADNPGEAVHSLEIEFVDFDNIATAEEAAAGVRLLWNDLEVGDYAGLRIGLGVPADLNPIPDSEFSGSHPLARPSHFWPGWESYIFTMINAKVDTDGDGQFDDSSVLYHTGSDECYRTKEILVPIRIEQDQVAELVFDIDLKQLFRDGAGGYIDILENTNTHDITDLSTAMQVMDNFRDALQVVD